MRFKDFLLSESGDGSAHNDTGSDWFYGNSLYPSDALDWPYDVAKPNHFAFLQARWKKERDEWGRKFHNIDVQDTIDKKFTSVYSNTMPSTDGGFWRHKNDDKPNTIVDSNAKMELLGHSKQAKIPQVLWKTNSFLDKTDELNRLFGKFEPSYSELASNFDKPWSPYSGEVKMRKPKKNKYHKHLNNF
jgi:hypothetical protein